nr:ADP-ribosyltransferase [Serratia marcescens]
MKYDILHEYKQYLYDTLNKNTAKTYYSAVNKVFRNLRFNDLSQIPESLILERVQCLGSKNLVSAAKNGLKHLHKFDNKLNLPKDEAFSDISKHKRNYVKSKGKRIDFDKTQKKVNSIRNKKLKLAFRLASISGLRVSELADLETKDLKFNEDGKIIVSVRNGKGGKSGQVECLDDKYVYKQLKEYCNGQEENTKLFYSESYMRERAGRLGLEMHDFRRAFATLKKMDCIDEGYSTYEANAKVQEGLRHERFSTTKRYLYGRKIVTKRNKTERAVPSLQIPENGEPAVTFEPYTKYKYDMVSVVDNYDLTPEEKDVLSRYSNFDYTEINASLYIEDYPDAEEWKNDIDRLTQCIDRKKIPDNIVVYRGVPDPDIIFGEDGHKLTAEELNEKYSGQLILHKSFMSTSIKRDVAEDFTANGDLKLVLTIKAPKTKKGLFMGNVTEHPEEDEILFQRSTFLEIESVGQNGNILEVQARIRGQLMVHKEG